jgi:hypothetical protein
VQRGEHAVGAIHAGEQVGDRHADALRVVGSGAGQGHQPRLALGDLVVARATALGTVVAEAGDREDDQSRVALQQGVDAEPQPFEHAGAEVLDQHVGAVDQLQQDVAVGVGLEVERHGLLVAVRREEVRRLPLALRPDEGRPPPAGVVAVSRSLDLHHPGAEVAEHHRGVRPREGPGQVDDEDAVQGTGHDPHPGRTRAAQTSSGPTSTTITE